jgi:hypothetical protein
MFDTYFGPLVKKVGHPWFKVIPAVSFLVITNKISVITNKILVIINKILEK